MTFTCIVSIMTLVILYIYLHLWSLGWVWVSEWAPPSCDYVDGISVCTMYVFTCITSTMVIPYCVLIQNYMKTFSKCKLALIVTPSNATLTVSSSSCSTTWILAVRVLLRRKDKVSLMTKRNTESVEIEKWLKKAIAGDFLCASGEVMLFVDSMSKVSWSWNQHMQSISVAFEPGKEILFINRKSPCNICIQASPKIVLQSSTCSCIFNYIHGHLPP